MRQKLKMLMTATEQGKHVSERSKTIGLFVISIFFGIAILLFLALTIGLLWNRQWLGALFCFLCGIGLISITYQMLKADNLHQL